MEPAAPPAQARRRPGLTAFLRGWPAQSADPRGLRHADEAGVVRRRATRSRRDTRPRLSSTHSVPRVSDGVSTTPPAACTLNEPSGTSVVRSSLPSPREKTRTTPSSPLETNASPPAKVTCCGVAPPPGAVRRRRARRRAPSGGGRRLTSPTPGGRRARSRRHGRETAWSESGRAPASARRSALRSAPRSSPVRPRASAPRGSNAGQARRPSCARAPPGGDVHDRHVAAARVGHVREPPVRRAGGVARLVEAVDDVADAQPRSTVSAPAAVCATTACSPTVWMLRGPGSVGISFRMRPSRPTASTRDSVSAVTSATGCRRRRVEVAHERDGGSCEQEPASVHARDTAARPAQVPSAEARQLVRELRTPRRPVVRHVVAPEVELAAGCPSRRAPRRSVVLASAPVVSSHWPWPQTSTRLALPRIQSRWSPPMCWT